MDWMTRAACAGMDRELFYPAQSSAAAAVEPLQVCASCPVRLDCLRYAMQLESPSNRWGIWGGTTPDERATMHRRTVNAASRSRRREAGAA